MLFANKIDTGGAAPLLREAVQVLTLARGRVQRRAPARTHISGGAGRPCRRVRLRGGNGGGAARGGDDVPAHGEAQAPRVDVDREPDDGLSASGRLKSLHTPTLQESALFPHSVKPEKCSFFLLESIAFELLELSVRTLQPRTLPTDQHAQPEGTNRCAIHTIVSFSI